MRSDRSEPIPLLVLVGPTAVGKTKYSLHLARTLNCEIISGDSMQVYRGMDIGTAKATPEERSIVPHHMIDIHDPDHPFSVAEFQERCVELIAKIHRRGRLPFIVGGTGLYIQSVCYGYRFSEGGADEAYREQLKQFAKQYGNEALHERLRLSDPQSAERIHVNDVRRTIRALEILHLTGKPMSEQLKRQPVSPYRLCMIGLTMDREQLYQRINQRVDEMMEQGLVEEVKQLLNKGYSADLVSMQGLGYKEIVGYVQGDYSLDEAVYLLKRNTRRFAKRQLSWFRRMPEIEWVDITESNNFAVHLHKISVIIAKRFQYEPYSTNKKI